MSSGRVTFLIVVLAIVALVAVVVSSGGIDLPSGGDDDAGQQRASEDGPSQEDASSTEDGGDGHSAEARAQPPGEDEPDVENLPENPDDVHGDDAYALNRPANLRRALATLERKRRPVEGVYDGLRVAPGRIDTIIIHPDDRMTNIQVRGDAKVSFENTHDFPTQPDFRKRGISARDVDVAAPAKMLRAIDETRSGSAAHDIDYFVISRDIIDGSMNIGAYMRIRTPRPRMFLKEQGEAMRAIG